MIEFDANDKIFVKKFFNTGGMVLDFTTPAFDYFCLQTVGVSICEKYELSKGKSFESFVDEYPTIVSMLLVKKLYENYQMVYDDLPIGMKKPEMHNRMDNLLATYDYLYSMNDNKDNNIFQISRDFDVFVSHASKDKLKAVDNLRNTLKSLGVNVWYDSDNIDWGDNLEKKILEGLEHCVFGIVVLSKSFFNSKWCDREIYQLIKRQKLENSNMILPLLLNVTVNEVIEKYPDLKYTRMVEYKKGKETDIALLFAERYINYLKHKV